MTVESKRATSGLRFALRRDGMGGKRLILQQLWLIRREGAEMAQEWRDVPVVAEDALRTNATESKR